jgi:hypothetical protein
VALDDQQPGNDREDGEQQRGEHGHGGGRADRRCPLRRRGDINRIASGGSGERARTSLSDFVRRKALEAAEMTMLERPVVVIPAKDWEAFEAWADRPLADSDDRGSFDCGRRSGPPTLSAASASSPIRSMNPHAAFMRAGASRTCHSTRAGR